LEAEKIDRTASQLKRLPPAGLAPSQGDKDAERGFVALDSEFAERVAVIVAVDSAIHAFLFAATGQH
jgi:hypothetical protein